MRRSASYLTSSTETILPYPMKRHSDVPHTCSPPASEVSSTRPPRPTSSLGFRSFLSTLSRPARRRSKGAEEKLHFIPTLSSVNYDDLTSRIAPSPFLTVPPTPRPVVPSRDARWLKVEHGWKVAAQRLQPGYKECLEGAECLGIFDPLEGLTTEILWDEVVHAPPCTAGASVAIHPAAGACQPTVRPALPVAEEAASLLAWRSRAWTPVPSPSTLTPPRPVRSSRPSPLRPTYHQSSPRRTPPPINLHPHPSLVSQHPSILETDPRAAIFPGQNATASYTASELGGTGRTEALRRRINSDILESPTPHTAWTVVSPGPSAEYQIPGPAKRRTSSWTREKVKVSRALSGSLRRSFKG